MCLPNQHVLRGMLGAFTLYRPEKPFKDTEIRTGMMRVKTSRQLLGAVMLIALFGVSACKTTEPAYSTEVGRELLLETSVTRDGEPIVYPTGKPKVTMRITTLPPKYKISVHRHPVPLFVYILEGELTIQTVGKPPHVYKEGEAFIEALDWHFGSNETDKPMKLLAIYPGQEDLPLSIRKDAEDAAKKEMMKKDNPAKKGDY